jgi:GT2 family glycosyltransferase
MSVYSNKELAHREASDSTLPLVSVVVLNFNGLSRLRTCFDAVIHQDYDNYEIIFVDNGSTDGSLQWANEKLSKTALTYRVEALRNNLGINRGKNRGASIASGKYLWLLDNDIAPDVSTLSNLVSYMEQNEDVALCGPLLTDFANPKKVVGGGFRLRTRYRRNRPVVDAAGSAGGACWVTYISGGVMFVRTRAWEELGGFEDSVMFSLNDTDFGVRCWLAGFKVSLLCECYARHWETTGVSGDLKKSRYRQRIAGVTRFILRNFSLYPMAIHLFTYELYLLARTAKYIVGDKQPGILLDYFSMQYDCATEFSETLRQRRAIQRTRQISKDIFLYLDERD